MKKIYGLVVAALLFALSGVSLYAQLQATYGTTTTFSGTTTCTSPYQRYWGSGKVQYILRASEIAVPTTGQAMTAGARITDIAFYVNVLSGDAGTGWKISIGHTTATAFANTNFLPDATNLVFGPSTISYTTGLTANAWNTHTFATPFTWNGVDNILIEVCDNNVGWPTHPSVAVNTMSFNSTLVGNGGTSGAFNGCAMTTGSGVGAGIWASRPSMRFNFQPAGVEKSFPDDNPSSSRILATELYDGTLSTRPQPSVTVRRVSAPAQFTYRIIGPLPSTNVVYQGLNSSSITDINIPVTAGTGLYVQNIAYATGPLAGINGALDARNAVGGSYQLEVVYTVPSLNLTQTWTKQFIIAFSNDIAALGIVSPRVTPYKYLRGIDVPIQARFQNVGLNPVTNARFIATIRNSGSQIIYQDTSVYTSTTGLLTGDIQTVSFKNFNTLPVGDYTLTVCSELLNATDQNTANNCLPTSGTHTFSINYDTEIGIQAILNPPPSSQIYVSRPITAVARFVNNGATDASDILTTLTIERLNNGTWTTVYGPVDKVITDIPFTLPATATLTYDPWTPTQIGSYRICITVNALNDPVASNNSMCQTFEVIDALNGTYTIGTSVGGSRNFTTIQSAVDAMYQRGVTGPVTFELTDGSYTVGDFTPFQPALDLSSRIIGVSSVNTVTFKPALLRSLSRASIGIRLQSATGIGIRFGQSVTPGNTFAVMNQFKNPQLYANSAGYITFDGGDQKSFRFMLDVGTATPSALPHRSVFYLSAGSSNISIRNSLIENYPQSTASYAAELPIVRYIAPNFTYDDDVLSLANGPQSYSAGIVSRAKVPSVGGNNSLNLDTLTNNNNRFIGNEISGFGYGVVSIGMGPLFYNDIAPNGNPRYQRYYNKNTEISKNMILSVRRAGIFVGYGENDVIADNRVLSVGIASTGVGGSTAGIMLGGAARPNEYVYNNIGSQVLRNEISNISSDVSVSGIVVEQTQNSFVNPAGGTVTFPNVNEGIRVTGNMVYSLSRTTQTATAAGIHLLTQRLKTASGLTRMITPQVSTYMSRGDSVVNNTVIMNADAVTSGSSVVALGVQHTQNAVVINNALAIQGTAGSVNTAAGNVLAAMFYEGLQPKIGGLSSNRNAFWSPNGAVVRFVEIDNTSQLLEVGNNGDYTNLGQWKAWTRQDINSVVGNFPAEHVATTTTPSKLRVNVTPAPLGSILDRRGDRTGAGLVDLDGDPRGLNGSRFTIGADEFVGRLYVNDIEAIEVLSPVSYRSGVGTFSDAEYIMTTAPVNVTARMRNNGSGAQAGVTIVAEIWREDPSGQFTSMVGSRTQQVSMSSGESVDIDFGFDKNNTFVPESYAALGWSSFAPAQFSTMLNNVTPRYRIRIYTTTDEFNPNNLVQKEVRFYIMKSNLKLLTSTVSSNVANPGTTTELVGRLNTDSLSAAFSAIGVRTSNNAMDLFERSGWEPRAVNYTMYRSMFWSGDTSRLTRLQRDDMRSFIAAGTQNDKRNLVVSSQEILGKHVGLDAINDEAFVRYVLRAQRSPQGATPRVSSYDGQNVKGVALARDIIERVSKTNHVNDGLNLPMPSLMRIYSDAQSNGLARPAYMYIARDAGVTDSIMGVATAALTYNVVYLGVDWRHFARTTNLTGGERVLRSIIEFIERSGSVVVPVELLGFDAKRSGEQVNVSWSTASEKNSSHFEVERSVVSEKGRSEFNVIRTIPAKGVSVTVSEYGMVDKSASVRESYVYRLKMVDLDGRTEYSNEVLVNALNDDMNVSVIPNPAVAQRQAQVQFTAGENGTADITLVDVSGREVLRTAVDVSLGQNTVNLSVPDVATGAYVVVVKQGASVQNINIQITR